MGEPIMKEFVEATKTEDGCVYYGWTVAGEKLFCREAYNDGAAVNAHLANVGPLIGKLLEDGVCKLDQIHQGPRHRVLRPAQRLLALPDALGGQLTCTGMDK